MPIPTELKEQNIWTLSSPDKIPLDLYDLYTAGVYRPLQLTSIGRCYTYDTAKKVQQQHPETYMTIHSDENTNFTLVDIEKEGVFNGNPFLTLDFVYFERSKSNGRHGILMYQVNSLNNIIKDKETETEFFKANHFMIITEDEIDIQTINHSLHQFESRLQPKFNDINNHIDGTQFEKVRLSGLDQFKLESIKFQHYRILDPDQSVNEFRYVRYITNTLRRHFGDVDEKLLIQYVIYITNIYLPYRNKHYQYANFSKYGYISKRLQLILDAVYSVIEQ